MKPYHRKEAEGLSSERHQRPSGHGFFPASVFLEQNLGGEKERGSCCSAPPMAGGGGERSEEDNPESDTRGWYGFIPKLTNRIHWFVLAVGIAIVLVAARPNGWPFSSRAESNTPALTIQCSSVLDNKPEHACANALPGVANDWISHGDKEGAWVEYGASDKQPFVVTSVQLIDRSSAGADILDGHFEFEGGTMLRYPKEGGIGALALQTEPLITFPEPITTTRIRFVVDKVSSTTEDAGLAEFRPYYVLGSVATGIPSSYAINCVDQFDDSHRCVNVAPYAQGDWWSREEPDPKDLLGAWIEIATTGDRAPVQLLGVQIAGIGDEQRKILKGHLEIAVGESGRTVRLPTQGSIVSLDARAVQTFTFPIPLEATAVKFVVDEAAPQSSHVGLSLFQLLFAAPAKGEGELLEGTIGVAPSDPDGSQPLIPLADYTVSKVLPCVFQEGHPDDVLSLNITSDPVTLDPTPPIKGKMVTLSARVQNDLRKTKAGAPTQFGLGVDWGDGAEGIAGPQPDQPLPQGSSVRVNATHTYTKLPQGLTIQLGTVDAQGVVNSPAYRCPVELTPIKKKSLAIKAGRSGSVGLIFNQRVEIGSLVLRSDIGDPHESAIRVYASDDNKTFELIGDDVYNVALDSLRMVTILFPKSIKTSFLKIQINPKDNNVSIDDIVGVLTAGGKISEEVRLPNTGKLYAVTVVSDGIDVGIEKIEVVDAPSKPFPIDASGAIYTLSALNKDNQVVDNAPVAISTRAIVKEFDATKGVSASSVVKNLAREVVYLTFHPSITAFAISNTVTDAVEQMRKIPENVFNK